MPRDAVPDSPQSAQRAERASRWTALHPHRATSATPPEFLHPLT